jgi:hypothetical protein
VSIGGLWLHSGFTGSVNLSTYTLANTTTHLRVDGGTLNLNSGTYTVSPGGIYLFGGTVNASSASISCYENFANNGGTFNSGTSAITFNGTASHIIGPTVTTLGNVIVATMLNLFYNTTMAGNLTINSGASFLTNGWAMTLGGNWTNNGTYTYGADLNDVITFTAGVSHTISGTNTFSSIAMDDSGVSTADTLTFPGGATTTLIGAPHLKGNSTHNLTVTSSTAPTKFTLTSPATTAGSPVGSRLTVTYSAATNSQHTGVNSTVTSCTNWTAP